MAETGRPRTLRLEGEVNVWSDEDGVFLSTHDPEVEILVELTGAAKKHVLRALHDHALATG